MRLQKFSTLLVSVALACAAIQPAFASPHLAPVQGVGTSGAIAGRYIVVFNKGTSDAMIDKALAGVTDAPGAMIHYRYGTALQGFAASLPDSALQALRYNSNIAYIEADQVIQAEGTQNPATWGIDRLDQRALPLNNTYTYNTTGSGVHAYIIDTGIKTSHNEFGGRASVSFDALGGNGQDCNGHGTHVAGTVGGATYGVAKGVSLHAVRVLDCSGSGTNSGVIAGVDWVTSNHQSPAVANMSLGGGASSALDTAVANSISSGVVYGIAAGNSNQDACRTSPARVASALTVGATTNTDARASYSNYGACLDLFAPGSSITSAWYSSNSATNTISGTSMATPHVVGVAALYRAAHPTATVNAVMTAIVGGTTANVVTSAGRNSPNRLLYSLLP